MRIRWNMGALEQARKSPEVSAELRRRADAIAAACGDGFVAVTGDGENRARAAVIAAHPKARRRNAKHNTLLRNINAGRR